MEGVPQSPVATCGHEGWAHTPHEERDIDLYSFPLNDRSMKLVPEKDSATSEAQMGVPLDDPEGTGQPKEEDNMPYGRVITHSSLPLTSTATAAPGGSKPPKRYSIGWGMTHHC